MKFSILRDLGTGFLGFLFCLSLSIVLILNFRPLYVYEMKSENLASVFSMTEEKILEEYDALIRYNSLFYHGELTLPSLPLSEEGRIHFKDVKRLFDGIQILLILTAATFLPLAIFRIRKKQFCFLKVIPGISSVLALLVFIATLLDWDALFTGFHRLVFQNDYWLFDPDTDPIIDLLPDSYFFLCLLGILGLLISLSLLSALSYHFLKKKAQTARK